MSAFAIDLASLRDARGEAQRAADAIALAGASAFHDMPQGRPGATVQAHGTGRSRSRGRTWCGATRSTWTIPPFRTDQQVSSGHLLNGGKVRSVVASDGPTWSTLNIIPAIDSQKVRVWVRRERRRHLLRRHAGQAVRAREAMSTAWANNAAPIVNCLKPFLIPDMWYESDKTTQDKNNNNYMEPDATANGNKVTPGEQWFYQPTDANGDGAVTGDYYAPFDPTITSPPRPQTGYGSNYRGDSRATSGSDPVQAADRQQPAPGQLLLHAGSGRAESPRGHQERMHQRRRRRHPQLVAGQRDRPGQAGNRLSHQSGPERDLEPDHQADRELGVSGTTRARG